MLSSLATGYAAVRGYQQIIDTVAHNLANTNTIAFKERRISFHELPLETLRQRRLPHTGNNLPEPAVGTGTAPASLKTFFETGALDFSGNPFHLAIMGEGFFAVTRPDGSRAYTRAGAFSVDAAGFMVTSGGDRLVGVHNLHEKGMDSRDGSLSIASDGKVLFVSSAADGAIAQETLGTIPLYRFSNPQQLLPHEDNTLIPVEDSGPPQQGVPGEGGFGEIKQGYLEKANVDLSQQMVALILGQRSLQAAARAMVVADELWTLTLNVRA
ncbi:MAG TPA: hypothetical protein DCQ14_05020 [Firmicutes bacterium]|nr:hypothetical protein [Bacillota bacterium]